MQKLHFIIIGAIVTGTIILLNVIPFLFPKYPDYQDFIKVYEWGEIETRTTSHIINHKSNYGYVDTRVAYFPYPLLNENCEVELLNFEVKPTSGVRFDGDFWKGTADYYWKRRTQEKLPAVVSGNGSRKAKISDIELSIKVKTGTGCKTADTIFNINEKLVLKMRRHTLLGFLSDLFLSV